MSDALSPKQQTELYSDYIIKEFTLPNTNEGKIGQDISLLHYVPIGNSVITKYNQWRTNLFTVAFSDDGNIYATNVENNLYGQKCYILFCKI